MTPERLNDLINRCFFVRRQMGKQYVDFAKFFGVSPITLRRWLTGQTPIPRGVEVAMEIFHRWPEISPEAVDQVIAGLAGTASLPKIAP